MVHLAERVDLSLNASPTLRVLTVFGKHLDSYFSVVLDVVTLVDPRKAALTYAISELDKVPDWRPDQAIPLQLVDFRLKRLYRLYYAPGSAHASIHLGEGGVLADHAR